MLDYRLLFVVLIGTLYGFLALVAALLASVGLAASYFTQYGYTFQGLFYEPSNWLPFIAYFVVGAVCGYVQLRNSEAIRAERDQNELVRNRNTFLTQLYHDAIEDKRAYRRQIVGRHDSFGKIFAVTQELDVLNPRDIYRKCCELLGEILGERFGGDLPCFGRGICTPGGSKSRDCRRCRTLAHARAACTSFGRRGSFEPVGEPRTDAGASHVWIHDRATGHPPC